jgi:alkenylglycerophosphocholine/alkenylglycerophosphoethanolamine hydrolase
VPDLIDPLVVFLLAVAAALLGVELKRRWLLIVAKPLATLSLLGVAMGGGTLTASLVTLGLLFSTTGDTALLLKSRAAFLVGLFAFLVAHLLYAAAFLVEGAGPAWSPLVGVLVFGSASGWLVRRMWGGLLPALRVPLMIYTATCTAMAAAAFSTLMGPWQPAASEAATAGALLFFLSDSNLAWIDFVEPYPHGQTVTLSLYWAGQLGIALAARWSG